MPEPKPTYTYTFKFKSSRPDAVAQALEHLQELASDADESGEASATLTIESFHEAPLHDIREALEQWLFKQDVWIDCEVTTKAPGLRPETREALLRARQQTPMDREWQNFANKNGASISGTLFGKRIDVAPEE